MSLTFLLAFAPASVMATSSSSAIVGIVLAVVVVSAAWGVGLVFKRMRHFGCWWEELPCSSYLAIFSYIRGVLLQLGVSEFLSDFFSGSTVNLRVVVWVVCGFWVWGRGHVVPWDSGDWFWISASSATLLDFDNGNYLVPPLLSGFCRCGCVSRIFLLFLWGC